MRSLSEFQTSLTLSKPFKLWRREKSICQKRAQLGLPPLLDNLGTGGGGSDRKCLTDAEFR